MGAGGAAFLGSDTIPNWEIKGALQREAPTGSSKELQGLRLGSVISSCCHLPLPTRSSGRAGGRALWAQQQSPPQTGGRSQEPGGKEREGKSPPGTVTSVWNFLLDRCKV